MEFISCESEKRLREAKTLSIIAFNHAAMIADMMGGTEVELMERFPFWTEAERMEAKRARLVNYMMSKTGGDPHG